MTTSFINGVEVGPDGKEWAKTAAGYAHVESIREQAWQPALGGRMWRGHAVREAFVAGAEWQEARTAVNGWLVGSSDGVRFRFWENGNPAWTADREKATRYARREDAQAVHEEDIEAWTLEPYSPIGHDKPAEVRR